MKLISAVEDVDFFSLILSNEPSAKRQTSRGKITELLVADLGELPWTSPYLIVCLAGSKFDDYLANLEIVTN
jgi:hypothetical protein